MRISVDRAAFLRLCKLRPRLGLTPTSPTRKFLLGGRGQIGPLLPCRRGWAPGRGRRRSRPGQLSTPEGSSKLLVYEHLFQTPLWPKRLSSRSRVGIRFQEIQTTNQLIFEWTHQGEGGDPGDKLSPHPTLPIGRSMIRTRGPVLFSTTRIIVL